MVKNILIMNVVITVALGLGGQSIVSAENFCRTQEFFEENYRSAPELLEIKCQFGDCDQPRTRDSWIPHPTDPVLTVRLFFNVFRNDDGSDPATTETFVNEQVDRLNADYRPLRIQFVHDMRFIDSSEYRTLYDSEMDPMKDAYALDPESQLNIYVATVRGGYSFGTFPWDIFQQPLSSRGGIVMTTSHFYPYSEHVLAHEVGHCLGLWHTFHGVSEVDLCSRCYEQADGALADSTGDLCSDTPPTPANYVCNDPGGIDPCSDIAWGETSPENYMSYSGDNCWAEFSPQQWGRMYCWIDDVLSSWTTLAVDVRFDSRVDTGMLGEYLPYSYTLENETDTTLTVELSLWVTIEGYEYMIPGSRIVNLRPGIERRGRDSIFIPPGIFIGGYILTLAAKSINDEILDEDSFPITVVGYADVEMDIPIDVIYQRDPFPLTASVRNQSDSWVKIDVSLSVNVNGEYENFVFDPRTISLRGEEVMVHEFMIDIPINAPPGEYIYILRAKSVDGNLLDRDSHQVTVMKRFLPEELEE
jgi:hypothetical protein